MSYFQTGATNKVTPQFRAARQGGTCRARTLDLRAPVIMQNQSTNFTPALTQNGNDLILGWTDKSGTVNTMTANAIRQPFSSTSFGSQESYFLDDIFANGGVSLATQGTQTYLAWAGTDPANLLNIRTLPSS